MDFLLHLVNVDVCDIGVSTVENSTNLLESRAFGLNIDEVDEDELAKVPQLRVGTLV
jgi:hypothetical protein